MNFSDIMSICTLGVNVIWMLLAYLVFKIQAKTFEAQIETFRVQQKVTELEQKKFLLSIKPEFELINSSSVNSGWETTHHYVKYQLKLKNNVATDFRLININRAQDFEIDMPPKQGDITTNRIIDIFEKTVRDGEVPLHSLQFEAHFCDEVGTKYLQVISGDLLKLQIGFPKQLK